MCSQHSTCILELLLIYHHLHEPSSHHLFSMTLSLPLCFSETSESDILLIRLKSMLYRCCNWHSNHLLLQRLSLCHSGAKIPSWVRGQSPNPGSSKWSQWVPFESKNRINHTVQQTSIRLKDCRPWGSTRLTRTPGYSSVLGARVLR
jgi:hypothetical protein